VLDLSSQPVDSVDGFTIVRAATDPFEVMKQAAVANLILVDSIFRIDERRTDIDEDALIRTNGWVVKRCTLHILSLTRVPPMFIVPSVAFS
jgi:hypothetical protein